MTTAAAADNSKAFLVYSPNEAALSDDEGGFWSNEDGWTVFNCATPFSEEEVEQFPLPAATGEDARWVSYSEAKKHFGEPDESPEVAAFKRKLGTCINAMLQDDAMGETMVFIREGSNLVPKRVSAEEIDLDNLMQYEMILFDGGNTAGDCWKHTFFPQRLSSHFVDENPLRRSSAAMEVSLDGGLTYQPAPAGVRIVYKGVMIDGEDGRGEVHLNATHEGLITDIWTSREEPFDHNIGTDSVTIEEIVSRLVEDNA